MKKKFLAILLGALMLVSMIPAMGMAATEAAAPVNLIPNGNFENGHYKGLPSADWTAYVANSAAGTTGILGSSLVVSSATYGETTISPATADSTSFLELRRHNNAVDSETGEPIIGSAANLTSSRVTNIAWRIPTDALRTGVTYRFEYYINVPCEMAEGDKVEVFFQNGNDSHYNVYRNHNWYAPDSYEKPTGKTNGWIKKAFNFQWDGLQTSLKIGITTNQTEAVVYIDELKIYELPVENLIISNGKFEDPFENSASATYKRNVPARDWYSFFNAGSGGSVETGSATMVTPSYNDAIQPATPDSLSILKFERYNATPSSLVKSRATRMYFPINSSILETGKFYKLEYYVNIPEALPSGIRFGVWLQTESSSFLTSPALNVGTPSLSSTNGWQKKSYTFEYDGGNYYLNVAFNTTADAKTGVAYLDDLTITEIPTPATSVVHSENFQNITTDEANTSTGGYVTRGNSSTSYGRGTVEIVSDPVSANAGNMVMKVNHKNTSNEVASVVPMSTNDTTKAFVKQYGDGHTMKISFRAYIPAQAYGDGLNTQTDGFKFGIKYNDNGAKEATATVSIGANKTDKWLDFEAYISAVQNTSFLLRFHPNFVGVFYVDDIEVGKINNNGYISDMNVEGFYNHARSAADGGSWAQVFVGNYNDTVSATSTVRPIVVFAPGNTTDRALALNAIYKVENGKRTLVDVKIDNLARVARTAYTGVTAAEGGTELGITSGNLAFNLEGMNLAAGSYEVETFLWTSALAPISAGRTVTFTK